MHSKEEIVTRLFEIIEDIYESKKFVGALSKEEENELKNLKIEYYAQYYEEIINEN